MPCRIIEIATTIMVTVTIRDSRIKTILSKVVRLIVQVGCKIDCCLDTLAGIRPFGYTTIEIRRSGRLFVVFLVRRTASVRSSSHNAPKVRGGWMTPVGQGSVVGVFEAPETTTELDGVQARVRSPWPRHWALWSPESSPSSEVAGRIDATNLCRDAPHPRESFQSSRPS
jgi:hypothetical protein